MVSRQPATNGLRPRRFGIPDVTRRSSRDAVSRRKFLSAASTGIAGTVLAGPAAADTLAEVPPREPGADLSGHSERSKYVQIGRIPEAGPGKRNVDPSDAINSKTPLDKLVGTQTPSDLHYERSHAGRPAGFHSCPRPFATGSICMALITAAFRQTATRLTSRIWHGLTLTKFSLIWSSIIGATLLSIHPSR